MIAKEKMGNTTATPAHYEGSPGAVGHRASVELKPLGKDKQTTLMSLLSPRKAKKQKMCDFAPLAEISPDEVELFENVGWGATGVIKKAKYRDMDCAAKLLFPGTDLARFKQELAVWWYVVSGFQDTLCHCPSPSSSPR